MNSIFGHCRRRGGAGGFTRFTISAPDSPRSRAAWRSLPSSIASKTSISRYRYQYFSKRPEARRISSPPSLPVLTISILKLPLSSTSDSEETRASRAALSPTHSRMTALSSDVRLHTSNGDAISRLSEPGQGSVRDRKTRRARSRFACTRQRTSGASLSRVVDDRPAIRTNQNTQPRSSLASVSSASVIRAPLQ